MSACGTCRFAVLLRQGRIGGLWDEHDALCHLLPKSLRVSREHWCGHYEAGAPTTQTRPYSMDPQTRELLEKLTKP